jgi:hypothetical protein
MRVPPILFLFVFAPLVIAESPIGPVAVSEGGATLEQTIPAAPVPKPRIDATTWALLGTDGAVRALDAYSTHRMLKNDCSLNLQMPGVSTCNYEQNLPGFLTHHASALYAFEGSVWMAEYAAVRLLERHHHRRLARFIPLIDILSTTSFAVNNLTLSIGSRRVDNTGQFKSERIPLNKRGQDYISQIK